MPFSEFVPRSFIAAAVYEHAPALSGVYGLSNGRRWVYIGETDNIQQTLLAHLSQLDPLLREQRPTGFVFEVCDRAERSRRQNRLILEYHPACTGLSAGTDN
jgi:hypothetical protein